MTKVRVRIAPSPTGDPHVGTAYIALFNWALAKKHGGAFVLRIEDTDQKRSKKEYETALLEALRWLGLVWDEGPDVGGPFGPYRQSERRELYQKRAQELVEKGAAYPCFCSEERLQKMREEKKARKESFLGYDGHCRRLSEEERRQKLSQGIPHVIRLKTPESGETSFEDYLRGKITWQNSELDDLVLLKQDGFPTYHLANVVDDHEMEISHVLRAEEWIASTPKHVLLYEAFGWEPPTFCHMPLLRNPDTSKISKRKNPCSLLYYQKLGILPQSLLNFLGLQGYSMPDEREFFTLGEFVDHFDLKRVKTRGPVFDLEKLYHLNQLHLQALSREEFQKCLGEYVQTWIEATCELAQPRLECLADFFPTMAYLFLREKNFQPQLESVVPKKLPSDQALSILKDFEEIFSQVSWTVEAIGEAISQYVKDKRLKKGPVFMLLRVALLEKLGTPPLPESLVLLERFHILERLRKSQQLLKSIQ